MPKQSPFNLTGKTALITGGSSGLGLAIAQSMLQHGAKVLIGSRIREKVQAAVKNLSAQADSSREDEMVAGVVLDVTRADSVRRAVRKAVDHFGSLDILVNSAGVMLRKPVFDVSPQEFNKLYDIHATGTLRCCQAAGAIFREQHAGCIINIASITSFSDFVEVVAYASAKAAVVGLTRGIANEWGKFGIRTNAIVPGTIPTDLNRKMIENTDRGRRILERTPLGRFGTPEEIGGAAVFLASSAASFINGHVLVIDGGFLACGIGDTFAPWAEPKE